MENDALYNSFVIHYGEIALKKKNRGYFEKHLVSNIGEALADLVESSPEKEAGKFVLSGVDASNVEEIKRKLSLIPGIVWFSPAVSTGKDIENIKEIALQLASRGEGTFKIETRRSDKSYHLNSREVNTAVGEALRKATGRVVDLTAPSQTIRIEIDSSRAYVMKERLQSQGGLPVGVSGKLVCLLSGGLDSPVAAYLMAKRGCRVVMAHFHNEISGGPGVLEKIKDLSGVLARFQGKTKIWIVPFGDAQKEIISCAPAGIRMIIYRRAMFRIASRIREREGALGFVTGDSIGQVSSQTLENLRCIFSASDVPVYTPLSGFDKSEIVAIGRRIGTYPVSILDYPDCCSFMIGKHPVTRGKIEEIERYERALSRDRLLEAFEKAEIHTASPQPD